MMPPRRILVALDGSAESEQILEEADRIAPAGAAFDLLHVIPIPNRAIPGVGLNLEDLAAIYLESVAERFPDRQVRTFVWRGTPEEEIPKAAVSLEADFLALTTHARRGVSHLLMGSVAEVVVRDAPVPVLLTRPGLKPPAQPLERILVPFDGTEGSGEIFDIVRTLAAGREPEVLLLEVMTPFVADLSTLGVPAPTPDPAPALEEQVRRLRNLGLHASAVVAYGDPAAQILLQARKFHVDLIAMATSGRKGLSRLLLGSVAESVVRRMDRPIVLHRISATSEVARRSQEQHAPGSD